MIEGLEFIQALHNGRNLVVLTRTLYKTSYFNFTFTNKVEAITIIDFEKILYSNDYKIDC